MDGWMDGWMHRYGWLVGLIGKFRSVRQMVVGFLQHYTRIYHIPHDRQLHR